MGEFIAQSGLVLAFIGCGNMGSAVLSGLLEALSATEDQNTTAPISSFIACTQSPVSAARLESKFAQHVSQRLTVRHNANLESMRDADVVILGCKPYMAEEVLGAEGLREALQGKLLISILAGTSPALLGKYLYGANSASKKEAPQTYITRAIPNLGAHVRESMTILEKTSPALPEYMAGTLEWIFRQIGQVKFVPTSTFDVATMLSGGSIALVALALDGILDGCVVEGMKRSDALEVAAQGVLGMTKLLMTEDGREHPAVLREKISSPRGCTIRSLLTLEKAGVRGTFAQAIMDGIDRLRQMGGMD